MEHGETYNRTSQMIYQCRFANRWQVLFPRGSNKLLRWETLDICVGSQVCCTCSSLNRMNKFFVFLKVFHDQLTVYIGRRALASFCSIVKVDRPEGSHLQHAASSSAPSSQSCFPSHNCDRLMHNELPSGAPFGHLNLFSGQSVIMQDFSSEPSWQSL